LNQFIFKSIILKNKSFAFATFGDWVLAHQLRIEASLQGIKLPAYFHTFLNIHKCFTEFYPENCSVSTVSGVMQGTLYEAFSTPTKGTKTRAFMFS